MTTPTAVDHDEPYDFNDLVYTAALALRPLWTHQHPAGQRPWTLRHVDGLVLAVRPGTGPTGEETGAAAHVSLADAAPNTGHTPVDLTLTHPATPDTVPPLADAAAELARTVRTHHDSHVHRRNTQTTARHPATAFDADELARLTAQYIGPSAVLLHITYGVNRITTADGVHLLITDCEAGQHSVCGFRCDQSKTATECDDPEHEWASRGRGERATVDISQREHTLGQAASDLAHAATAILRTLRSHRP
jgi:hypothetical protein